MGKHDPHLDSEDMAPLTMSFMSLMKRYAGIAAVFLLFAGVTMWYWQRSEVIPPTLSQDEQMAMARTIQDDEKKVEVVEASETVKVLTKKELMEYNVDEEFVEALESGRKVTTYTDKD